MLMQALRHREEGNPDFDFMNEDSTTVAGRYYRWRAYSFAVGDSAVRWRDTPFQYSEQGPYLKPPVCAQYHLDGESDEDGTKSDNHNEVKGKNDDDGGGGGDGAVCDDDHAGRGSDSDSDHAAAGRTKKRSRSSSISSQKEHDHRRSRRDDATAVNNGSNSGGRGASSSAPSSSSSSRYAGMTGAQIERARAADRSGGSRTGAGRSLSVEDREKWLHLLSELDSSRLSIKKAMGFAFDKVECAFELCTILSTQLLLPSPHAAVKLAGLYLLSDLLHNSGCPIKHASKFRSAVCDVLPTVFENIGAVLRSTGRMTAFQIEERTQAVFSAWSSWSVFPALYIMGLKSSFHMTESDHKKLQSDLAEAAAKDAAESAATSKKTENKTKSAAKQEQEREKAVELEGLIREAKLAAVVFDPATVTIAELKLKLEYVRSFVVKLLETEKRAAAAAEERAEAEAAAAYAAAEAAAAGAGATVVPDNSSSGGAAAAAFAAAEYLAFSQSIGSSSDRNNSRRPASTLSRMVAAAAVAEEEEGEGYNDYRGGGSGGGGGDDYDLDDIDGAPMPLHIPTNPAVAAAAAATADISPASGTAFGRRGNDTGAAIDGEGNVEEDIDGIPLDGADDDEDIDGIPM